MKRLRPEQRLFELSHENNLRVKKNFKLFKNRFLDMHDHMPHVRRQSFVAVNDKIGVLS